MVTSILLLKNLTNYCQEFFAVRLRKANLANKNDAADFFFFNFMIN